MMKKFGSAVILAGGKSTRMGYDKQLIDIKGKNLIERQCEVLSNEFDEIILVSNGPVCCNVPGCNITGDIIPGMGPLSGIHAGLKRASSEYAYFIACDMPYINMDYIMYMKKRLAERGGKACVTRLGEWLEPFNAFYSKKVIPDIEASLAGEKSAVHKFIKNLDCLYIEENEARKFSPDWGMFYNINTKEELAVCITSINAK